MKNRTKVILLSLLLISPLITIANSCPSYKIIKRTRLTVHQLSACSCLMLDGIRNEIYARHGHQFKRFDLSELFESFDWYAPRDHMTPLNIFESHNALLIRTTEEQRGCILSKRFSSLPTQRTTRNIFQVIKKYLETHPVQHLGHYYTLIRINRIGNWATVRLLPKTDLQTLDIILHKIEDQWIVKDMAVYLTKWEKRFPHLFK